jgi:two-component system, cell cycle sensor histidine kinase PleC
MPPKPRSPKVRNLILFSSIIVLIFCFIVAYQASQSYRFAVANGHQNAERLTSILSDHVELTFLAADMTLRRAIERQYFNQLFGNNIPRFIEQNLRIWVDETPQIAAMLLVDEKGKPMVAAHKKNYRDWLDYKHYDFKAAPFFAQMVDASDRYFWISILPSQSSASKDLILISRKVTKVNGEFGGIVVAAIDPAYFVDFFTSVGAGARGQMAVTLHDGTMLVRGPHEDLSMGILPAILADYKDSPHHSKIRSGEGSDNDKLKIFSYKTLKNIPIIIAVILDEDDFLAEWWQARIKDIGFLAIFTVFGSVLSFFALTMARQIVRVEESEASAVLASQAKSEFLANMSHELRTPLNAIIGFSEMLNSGYFGPLNPKQKERINDINLCGSHLLQLISDILEFSKGEAGKLELTDEKMNLPEIVNETLRMMNEKISGKGLTVLVDVERDLPRLWGDKRKVRQILLNLLSNAVKFTPEGGTIKVTLKQDTYRNMTMTVSDTGVGIPEEQIARALSVFGQVHREHSHEGTGLGLPLCKMFAELHGGRLAIGSTVGEGTTVRITFPRSRVIFDEQNAVSPTEVKKRELQREKPASAKDAPLSPEMIPAPSNEQRANI